MRAPPPAGTAERVNVRGELIAIDPAGPLSEAAWTKERLSRAKQTLPNGYCGLPLRQSCPHPNACLTCDYFLTTEQFLPVHRDQLSETERLIAEATAQGSQRKLEMNENVKLNLVRIIEGLESISEQRLAVASTPHEARCSVRVTSRTASNDLRPADGAAASAHCCSCTKGEASARFRPAGIGQVPETLGRTEP